MRDRDAQRVGVLFSDSLRISFGPLKMTASKSSLCRSLAAAFTRMRRLEMRPMSTYQDGPVSVMELDVCCERGHEHIEFPMTAVIESPDGLISEIRLFSYETSMIGTFFAGAAI